jgi:hypothetical protein
MMPEKRKKIVVRRNMLLRKRRGSRMIELTVKAPQITPKNKKIKLFSPLRVHAATLFPEFFSKKETF